MNNQDELRFYKIRYPGSYLGGNAVVRAYDKQNAYEMLLENYPSLDPIERCVFTKIDGSTIGVLYNWDGDY